MELTTLLHHPCSGWSKSFPQLDSPETLVTAFGAPELFDNPGPIAELAAAFPTSVLVGCSSAGEIHGGQVNDGTLSVAIARFSNTPLRLTSVPIQSPLQSREAGEAIGMALDQPDLRGVFVLSDGLGVNGSELVRGITAAIPAGSIVTGGLAGDGDRFQRTWVIDGGRPASGRVVAVGFYGDRVKIGHGSKGGWDIFGRERVVTRSEGNVLYELDGEPALDLYKEYLGELASQLPASALLFPLALRAQVGDEPQLVRTVLAIDEKHQAMVFAGDVPEGHLAQLMQANFDRLVSGAEGAAEDAFNTDEGACLAIAISCVGRRLVLGERTEEEVEATLAILPAGSQQVGFYSYGEISPVTGGSCELHNQTMTLTTFSEAA